MFRPLLVALTFAVAAPLAAEPKRGGTLVFGRGGDAVGLDPAARDDGESLNVTDHIYDTLVKLKPGTTEIIPSLATSWTVSPDGKAVTFTLVQGARFHDGTPVNADAVVFNFKRMQDPKHPAHAFGGPYAYFAAMGLDKLLRDVVKVDDHTVRFELSRPHAPFIGIMTMPAFGIVSPTAVLKDKQDFAMHPVGSGPYKLKAWDKKQKLVLEANDDYWGPKPYLKTLIFRPIPDNNARLQEMMAGNLHAMDNPDTNGLAALSQRLGDRVRLAKTAGFNVGYLAINVEKKPFDNVLVRRALAYAINKPAIIASVYNGYATPAKNPMPPSLWSYDDDIKNYGYDPVKAKALLKEAGLEGGFETDLWAMPVSRPYMPDGRKVAEAIQGDLAKVGIRAKIISYDWGTYLQKTSDGEHALALMGWTGDIGDPDNFLYVLLDKDNAVRPAENICFYKSEKVHQLLTKARSESDQAKRTALYREAQVVIHDDVPLIPLAHSVEVVPLKKEVQGFVMDPTGRRNFSEVWLER